MAAPAWGFLDAREEPAHYFFRLIGLSELQLPIVVHWLGTDSRAAHDQVIDDPNEYRDREDLLALRLQQLLVRVERQHRTLVRALPRG
jgi:hypothetical protein